MFLSLWFALFAIAPLSTPATWSRTGWVSGPPSTTSPLSLLLPCLPFVQVSPNPMRNLKWSALSMAIDNWIPIHQLSNSLSFMNNLSIYINQMATIPFYWQMLTKVVLMRRSMFDQLPMGSPLWNVFFAMSPRPFLPQLTIQMSVSHLGMRAISSKYSASFRNNSE